LTATADRILPEFRAGKSAALARAVSIVENRRDGADRLLANLHPSIGRARRIGITGPPGAGKSTITALLARDYRAKGHRVGIVCVDPTSPFTGGALLGDRVRMESVALDDGVFIRSMATRGSLGGLAATTREVADVLDAFGFDRILLETVGVGQSELDIANTADSTIVALVPESGDSIQTLKAGVMEIADIFVINKSDRPGADRLRSDVELMLGLRRGTSYARVPAHHGVDLKRIGKSAKEAGDASPTKGVNDWTPPVLRAVAAQGEGIGEIVESLERHFNYLESSGKLRDRRRRALADRVTDAVERRMRGRLWRSSDVSAWLAGRIPDVESAAATPYAVADELLSNFGKLVTRADE
jgi:GTPase